MLNIRKDTLIAVSRIINFQISVGEMSISPGNILVFFTTIQIAVWISSLTRYILHKEAIPRFVTDRKRKKLTLVSMKSKLTKGLVLSYLISLLMACNTRIADPEVIVVDKEQIKKGIQAKEDEFAEIYNTGELRRIGYYAEDATTFAQNQAPIVGREAIIEYLKVDVEFNADKISFTTKEVFPSNDRNLVVEIGYYKVVDSSDNAINTGNYMCLFEKRDGKYYCVREMSASDMPVQKPK